MDDELRGVGFEHQTKRNIVKCQIWHAFCCSIYTRTPTQLFVIRTVGFVRLGRVFSVCVCGHRCLDNSWAFSLTSMRQHENVPHGIRLQTQTHRGRKECRISFVFHFEWSTLNSRVVHAVISFTPEQKKKTCPTQQCACSFIRWTYHLCADTISGEPIFERTRLHRLVCYRPGVCECYTKTITMCECVCKCLAECCVLMCCACSLAHTNWGLSSIHLGSGSQHNDYAIIGHRRTEACWPRMCKYISYTHGNATHTSRTRIRTTYINVRDRISNRKHTQRRWWWWWCWMDVVSRLCDVIVSYALAGWTLRRRMCGGVVRCVNITNTRRLIGLYCETGNGNAATSLTHHRHKHKKHASTATAATDTNRGNARTLCVLFAPAANRPHRPHWPSSDRAHCSICRTTVPWARHSAHWIIERTAIGLASGGVLQCVWSLFVLVQHCCEFVYSNMRLLLMFLSFVLLATTHTHATRTMALNGDD